MKFGILFSLNFLLLLSNSSAGTHVPQGVVNGGGGGAYVCRGQDNEVKEVHLVDLFEAEANGLTINYDNPASIDSQVEEAIAKLASIHPWFASEVGHAFKHVRANEKGGPNVVIEKPTDVNEKYSKAGCALEGIMFFDDLRGTLVRNTTLFAGLKFNRAFAAAYLHEAIYKVARDFKLPGRENSVRTRLLVGCLMAEGDLGSCLQLSPLVRPQGKNVWKCETMLKGNKTSFYIHGFTGQVVRLTAIQQGSLTYSHQTYSEFYDPRLDLGSDDSFESKVVGEYDYMRGGVNGFLEGIGGVLPIRSLVVLSVKPLTIKINDESKKVKCY